jgi:hypothetical protein
MAQRAFDVFRFSGRHTRQIDTVFATGYTADEMRRSLINHDGYPADISVYRRHPQRYRVYDDAARVEDYTNGRRAA